MKGMIRAILAALFMFGAAGLTGGCSSSNGRYFENTRRNQPNAFHNRIYNPADYRYTQDGAES